MGIAVGVHDGVFYGLTTGLANGLILGPVFGIAVGLARGLTVWLVFGLLLGFNVLGAGVGAGLVEGEPLVGLAFGIVGSVPIAVVVVLSVKRIGFTPAQGPAYAGAIGEVTDGLVSGLVNGLAFGLSALFAIGVTDWAETRPGPSSPSRSRSESASTSPAGAILPPSSSCADNGEFRRTCWTSWTTPTDSGILRESGPVYQFRHAKLQDRLARSHVVAGRDLDAATRV